MKRNMNGRGGVVVFGLRANMVRRKTPIRIAIKALRLLMLFSFLTATALAQTETGQITGTVFDQTGGFIPNATVTATDLATTTARSVMTSDGI